MYLSISFKVNFKVFLFVFLNTFLHLLSNQLQNFFLSYFYQLLNNIPYLLLFYKTFQIPFFYSFLFLRGEVQDLKRFLHLNVILFSQKVFQGILISFVCWPSFVL